MIGGDQFDEWCQSVFFLDQFSIGLRKIKFEVCKCIENEYFSCSNCSFVWNENYLYVQNATMTEEMSVTDLDYFGLSLQI